MTDKFAKDQTRLQIEFDRYILLNACKSQYEKGTTDVYKQQCERVINKYKITSDYIQCNKKQLSKPFSILKTNECKHYLLTREQIIKEMDNFLSK